jgi:hypothetical protein
MYRHKVGPRWEHKDKEAQRAAASPTLAQKFVKLKSLTVSLDHQTREGNAYGSQITHTVNLANARSVFRMDCRNDECIRGDFDLTKQLAKAIAQRATTVTGEVCCQGWQNKARINVTKCHNVLRYKLKLAY